MGIGFDDMGGGLHADAMKTDLHQGRTQGFPVKTKMKDTGVVRMKTTLLQVEIGNAQTPPRG